MTPLTATIQTIQAKLHYNEGRRSKVLEQELVAQRAEAERLKSVLKEFKDEADSLKGEIENERALVERKNSIIKEPSEERSDLEGKVDRLTSALLHCKKRISERGPKEIGMIDERRITRN